MEFHHNQCLSHFGQRHHNYKVGKYFVILMMTMMMVLPFGDELLVGAQLQNPLKNIFRSSQSRPPTSYHRHQGRFVPRPPSALLAPDDIWDTKVVHNDDLNDTVDHNRRPTPPLTNRTKVGSSRDQLKSKVRKQPNPNSASSERNNENGNRNHKKIKYASAPKKNVTKNFDFDGEIDRPTKLAEATKKFEYMWTTSPGSRDEGDDDRGIENESGNKKNEDKIHDDRDDNVDGTKKSNKSNSSNFDRKNKEKHFSQPTNAQNDPAAKKVKDSAPESSFSSSKFYDRPKSNGFSEDQRSYGGRTRDSKNGHFSSHNFPENFPKNGETNYYYDDDGFKWTEDYSFPQTPVSHHHHYHGAYQQVQPIKQQTVESIKPNSGVTINFNFGQNTATPTVINTPAAAAVSPNYQQPPVLPINSNFPTQPNSNYGQIFPAPPSIFNYPQKFVPSTNSGYDQNLAAQISSNYGQTPQNNHQKNGANSDFGRTPQFHADEEDPKFSQSWENFQPGQQSNFSKNLQIFEGPTHTIDYHEPSIEPPINFQYDPPAQTVSNSRVPAPQNIFYAENDQAVSNFQLSQISNVEKEKYGHAKIHGATNVNDDVSYHVIDLSNIFDGDTPTPPVQTTTPAPSFFVPNSNNQNGYNDHAEKTKQILDVIDDHLIRMTNWYNQQNAKAEAESAAILTGNQQQHHKIVPHHPNPSKDPLIRINLGRLVTGACSKFGPRFIGHPACKNRGRP